MEPSSSSPPTTSKLTDVIELTEILIVDSSTAYDKLRDTAAQAYLSELTAFSLDQLLAEPGSLQTQAHHLTASLTSLTHTSYPTFLSLHQTTNALTTSLASLTSSLDALLTVSIPALEDSASNWKERTDTVVKERNNSKNVLDQHEKIRDLLEVPLLIDTCVRNGYFAEALSLVAHAKSVAASLTSPDGTPPPLMRSVLAEVNHSVVQMLLSLLSTLYEPNRKLPSLWKAVNFLRKLDVFGPKSQIFSPLDTSTTHLEDRLTDFIGFDILNEEQIALTFLLGRESCLKLSLDAPQADVIRMTRGGELDEREREDLARYLKRYIDLWRETVHDIITQYSTIFLEKAASGSIQTSAVDSPSNPEKPSAEELIRLRALINTYASRGLTTHLLPALSSSLNLLSLPLLNPLFSQLNYCSAAFARLGLDFRSAISLLFSDAIVAVVSRDTKAATSKFSARFSTTRSANIARPDSPSKWIVIPSAAISPPLPPSDTPASSATNPPHIPPQILASYPPLALHTNDLLTVLNGLRLIALTNVLHSLLAVVEDDVLVTGGSALLVYLKATNSSQDVTDQEKKIVLALAQVYFATFVPFLRRAVVGGVYGSDVETFTPGKRLQDLLGEWKTFKDSHENLFS